MQNKLKVHPDLPIIHEECGYLRGLFASIEPTQKIMVNSFVIQDYIQAWNVSSGLLLRIGSKDINHKI